MCVSGREFRIEALFSLCVFVCLCVVCVCVRLLVWQLSLGASLCCFPASLSAMAWHRDHQRDLDVALQKFADSVRALARALQAGGRLDNGQLRAIADLIRLLLRWTRLTCGHFDPRLCRPGVAAG